MSGLLRSELSILKRLTTPSKVQDYLQKLDIHFEDKYWSPRRVMREQKAQCFEGAVLAALAFSLHGQPPLLIDLKSTSEDQEDHVIAPFRRNGRWGAVSKTNHAVLRYREPIFRDLHALAASYFHEYFLHSGRKTLLSYSKPLNLRLFNKRGWATSEESLEYLVEALDRQPHIRITPTSSRTGLRRADDIEIKAGKLVEQKRKKT